jgi:hypothetical protein
MSFVEGGGQVLVGGGCQGLVGDSKGAEGVVVFVFIKHAFDHGCE